MSIEGRIAVDVSFSDLSTATTGVQSLKRVVATSTDSYTSGKVAIITGTLGTVSTAISLAPTTYRDSNGDIVSFSSVSRLAFSCSTQGYAEESPRCRLFSRSGSVSVGDVYVTANTAVTVAPSFTAGTASYTLVIVGT
jgi:hypothetical protein